MRRTRSPCCARAASGQAAAPPSSAMNSRGEVAVGTRVASRPPHRPVRAAFPHTVANSGTDNQALRLDARELKRKGLGDGPAIAELAVRLRKGFAERRPVVRPRLDFQARQSHVFRLPASVTVPHDLSAGYRS